jgi:hypothetical protein
MLDENYQHVQNGLQILRLTLAPYVVRMMQYRYAENWWVTGILPHIQRMEQLRNQLPLAVDDASRMEMLDTAALLTIMDRQYGEVFIKDLGREGLGYVHELLAIRNHWAHEDLFTRKAALRAVDTIILLLGRIKAPEQADAERLQEEFAAQDEILSRKPARRRRTRLVKKLVLGFTSLLAVTGLIALGFYISQAIANRQISRDGSVTGTKEVITSNLVPAGDICTCTLPDLDCDSFSTQKSAQACFDNCRRQGLGDFYRLDSNHDGKACTSLP